MRSRGLRALSLGAEGVDGMQESEQLERFATGFPDQHGWLLQLGRFFGADRVGSLRCALRHGTGAPELLSMECCLYMACMAKQQNYM